MKALDLDGFDFDRDALVAAVDLAGRGRSVEIGYQYDGAETIAAMGWYAQAAYKGARLIEEGRGPVEALARRLLKGARCRRCGKPVRLNGERGCRWTRRGDRWVPGCGKPIDRSIPAPLARGSDDA